MARNQSVRKTGIQKRDDYIHIETDGCIVNIYPGLFGVNGNSVTSIEVLADGDRFSDGFTWYIQGTDKHKSACIRVERK